MAMTISGLSESQLDDKLIPAIAAVAPTLDIFSHAFTEEGLVQGNSYIVPVVGALTLSDKTAGTTATANASLTGKSVTASSFRGVSWEIQEGKVPAKLAGAYMVEQAAEGVSKLGCAVIDAGLAILTEANYGTGGNNQVVDADFDNDTMVALRSAAKSKLKGMPGAFVCNSSVASKLIAVNQFVAALSVAKGEDYYTDSKLPSAMLGYRAFEYCDLPGNSENLVGAVIGKGAIAIVAGAPDQLITSGQGDVAYRRIITDPVSGLSVQYTESISAGGKIVGEVAAIFGAAKALDAATLLATA